MIRTRSLVAAFVVLALLGIVLREDPRAMGATSFGYVPSGHRALFELLVGLGWPVARSYAPPDLLLPSSTVWWVEPRGLCDRPDAEKPDAGASGSGRALATFVERGGTALVALSAQPSLLRPSVPVCGSLVGVTLPSRELPAPPEQAASDDDERGSDGREDPVIAQRVDGDLVERARLLELPPLAAFEAEPATGWRVRARVEDRPLVLERVLGRGHLVVVADASFLRNRWLDAADAALLAVDLARAYGVDSIDEHAHGLRFEDPDALAFLVSSPALPLFVGLALLGGLVFWWGSARPAPLPALPAVPAPTLEGFVQSLAALYGRSGDHARLAERYRELSLSRLRRHLGLPCDTPLELVLARLRRQGLDEASLADLATPTGAGSPGELRRGIRRFDAIVEEGSR